MPRMNNTPETSTQDGNGTSKWIRIRWVLLRLILVVYDILAINTSVYLAFITRFYVAKEFHTVAAHYFAAYNRYAVVYTVFCVFVFACFKLYSGIWKYAGFNDLNRILAANALAFAGHVAGTLLFGIRMPITIYCISGTIQLFLVGASRFSYRLLLIEKDKILYPNRASINALIVGVGGTARSVIKQLEHESVVRPACMLDYKESGFGTFFDGIPVVNGVENLRIAIEKHNITLVVLASTVIPQHTRTRIKQICAELNVEVQDYSGFFLKSANEITLGSIAKCGNGKIELVVNGRSQLFDDGEQALTSTAGKYIVKSISAKNNVLVVELADYDVVLNDLNAEWVKEQEKETGEEISFF